MAHSLLVMHALCCFRYQKASYPIQVARLDPSLLVKSSIMCLLFLFDICAAIAADSDSFKWKSKGSVKMKPVGTESWIFAIPELLQIGFFLKNKYNIYKVKSTRSTAITRIPAGQDKKPEIYFTYCRDAFNNGIRPIRSNRTLDR